MSIVQFTTEITSLTITVPELSQFVGKTVQITVLPIEEKPRKSWPEIRALADQLDLEYDAIEQQAMFEIDRVKAKELLWEQLEAAAVRGCIHPTAFEEMREYETQVMAKANEELNKMNE